MPDSATNGASCELCVWTHTPGHQPARRRFEAFSVDFMAEDWVRFSGGFHLGVKVFDLRTNAVRRDGHRSAECEMRLTTGEQGANGWRTAHRSAERVIRGSSPWIVIAGALFLCGSGPGRSYLS